MLLAQNSSRGGLNSSIPTPQLDVEMQRSGDSNTSSAGFRMIDEYLLNSQSKAELSPNDTAVVGKNSNVAAAAGRQEVAKKQH